MSILSHGLHSEQNLAKATLLIFYILLKVNEQTKEPVA
jgi:hypothetical protein